MAVKKIDKSTQNTVALLAANGATVTKISRDTGLHHNTVKKVLQEPMVVAKREDIEARIADKFELLTEAVLDSISEDDLLKASLQQKSISAATLLDKSRLIRGTSTLNIAVIMARTVIEAGQQWEPPSKQQPEEAIDGR